MAILCQPGVLQHVIVDLSGQPVFHKRPLDFPFRIQGTFHMIGYHPIASLQIAFLVEKSPVSIAHAVYSRFDGVEVLISHVWIYVIDHIMPRNLVAKPFAVGMIQYSFAFGIGVLDHVCLFDRDKWGILAPKEKDGN